MDTAVGKLQDYYLRLSFPTSLENSMQYSDLRPTTLPSSPIPRNPLLLHLLLRNLRSGHFSEEVPLPLPRRTSN